MPRVELNKPAPDFSLEDYTGRAVSLSEFQDSFNILLVFNRGFA